jgi:hypothetical protein
MVSPITDIDRDLFDLLRSAQLEQSARWESSHCSAEDRSPDRATWASIKLTMPETPTVRNEPIHPWLLAVIRGPQHPLGRQSLPHYPPLAKLTSVPLSQTGVAMSLPPAPVLATSYTVPPMYSPHLARYMQSAEYERAAAAYYMPDAAVRRGNVAWR